MEEKKTRGKRSQINDMTKKKIDQLMFCLIEAKLVIN